jgi:hypothetical protein
MISLPPLKGTGITGIKPVKKITVQTIYKQTKITFIMKRRFTTVLWAGATLALAFANVPTAAGQEKAVIKTGRIERISDQKVQLRADKEVELPDSAIRYSPEGEKIAKHVYLPGESYGLYKWENGAWKFESAYPIWYGGLAKYDRESFKERRTVYTDVIDGALYIHFPLIENISSYFNYLASADAEHESEYDANGNLIYFKVMIDYYWYDFSTAYNEKNRPISVEGRVVWGGGAYSYLFLKRITNIMIMDVPYMTVIEEILKMKHGEMSINKSENMMHRGKSFI